MSALYTVIIMDNILIFFFLSCRESIQFTGKVWKMWGVYLQINSYSKKMVLCRLDKWEKKEKNLEGGENSDR